MQQNPYLTIGEIATTFDIPPWLARRVVDSVVIDVPRAGQYRLVPRQWLDETANEIVRRGLAPSEGASE